MIGIFRYVNALACFIVLLAVIACQSGDPHKGRIPLAGVDGSFLYKDEVDLMYAVDGQGEDSAAYVDAYIKKWIVETLFFDKAHENVASDNDIDRRVELYRRNLILNDYQERLVVQQLEPSLNDEEIMAFYEENGEMFEAEESLMRGYLLKLPTSSPRMNELRRWCVGKSDDDLEKIEKYCLSKDATFECFFEDWVPVSSIADKTPLTEYQLKERLTRCETIEFNNDGYTFFVSADTLISKGERKPLEMVSGEIKKLLLNSKMASFIKEKKRALYDEALQRNGIEIFNLK
jgi:hypothetical protein